MFRILRRPIDMDLLDAPKLMHAWFILHNICESRKEYLNAVSMDAAQRYDQEFQPPCFANRSKNGTNLESETFLFSILIRA